VMLSTSWEDVVHVCPAFDLFWGKSPESAKI
jgi:hypothetical protein